MSAPPKTLMSRTLARLFRRAAAKCQEHPIKIYALMYMGLDLFFGANPAGGPVWAVGGAIGAAANLNKAIFGHGGAAVDPDAFRITWRGARAAGKEALCLPFRLVRPSYWGQALGALSPVKGKMLWGKAKRAASQLTRYPLDAGWLLYIAAGAAYVADASGGLGPGGARPMEMAIGGLIIGGSGLAFATDDTKLAAPVFGCISLCSFVAGALTLNPVLLISPLGYLYANSVMSRVSTAHQSAHTKRQIAPEAT